MLLSFLKIAFRNLTWRKGYALLNIAGLAIGITCCLLIFEYVAYERSYDDFHDRVNRIFRVQDEEYQRGQMVVACAAAMPGVAPYMRNEFAEVENAGRLRKISFLMGNDVRNLRFKEPDVYYADQSILDIFNVPLLYGDLKTALAGPGKVIISESEAQKYFGNENALGKVLTIYSGGSRRPLEISGVFKNYPANSHLKLSILVSYPTYSKVIGTYGKPDDVLENGFGWTDFYTYILLKKGADPKHVVAKLPAFMNKHYNDVPENKNNGDRYSLSLMPLKDIHLYSRYTEEAEANGDGKSVTFLFFIGLFIVSIAWVNYINLATARSLERAREVGVRKVLGAMSRELIWQFMIESFLLNLLALLLAILITWLIGPLFSQLSGRDLPSLFSMGMIYKAEFVTLMVLGTFLSGLYPAFVLSRYRPVAVLKGLFKNTVGGQWLRKGLIVGQFAASITLIAGTMIVYRQVQYMQKHDLGVNINETIVIRGAYADSAFLQTYSAFKRDALEISGVKGIASSSAVMGEEILWSTNWFRSRGGKDQAVNLFHLGIDDDFIRNYGLKVLAGESFGKRGGAETRKVMLNESAVHMLGFLSPRAAVGQLISGDQNNMDSMQIVGVISNYHNEGLQKAIQPLVFFLNRNTRNNYSVKIEGTAAVTAIASLKKVWDRHFPTDPFYYFFLDEFFNRQYAENRRFGEVFGVFALLAIGIACFGLLGLSAYNVLQRTKEIGVRKVLGASVQNLLFILSKDFLALVIIAFVIAIPVTGLAMSSWLENFAYRTAINWWVFAVAGILSILIALFTVGVQALRAALANPVESLRTE